MAEPHVEHEPVLVQLWEKTQVELQGHYSAANVLAFHSYHTTTSWRRVAFFGFLTPIPSILMVLAVDTLPLEPMGTSPYHAPNIWIRNLIAVTQCGICMCEQFRYHLPQLALQHWEIVIIGIVAAVTSISFCFKLSLTVGFPVPFSMLAGTIPWTMTIVIMIVAFKWRQIRASEGLMVYVMRYQLVMACQITMTIIYPAYNFVYKNLSSTEQTAFVLLLPLMKIASKNWISRALLDSDDAKPEAVVFNVEIFHALFVSLCMGNTSSNRTVFILMAIDMMQAWLSFREVLLILRRLEPLSHKLQAHRRRARLPTHSGFHDLVAIANQIIRDGDAKSKRVQEVGTVSKLLGVQHHLRPSVKINPVVEHTEASLQAPNEHPSSQAIPQELNSPELLTTEERNTVVMQTRKLLFMTEFIVLIEYVEVIMPLMYSVYVVGLFYLPNRSYYPFLDGIVTISDLWRVVSNVLFYALLELLSLVLMTVALWRKLRLSAPHQLTFVLERRFGNVQAKLLLWVLDVIENAIVQLGADYSLQFSWLNPSTR